VPTVALSTSFGVPKTRTTGFRDAFLDHFAVRWLVMADAKTSPGASQPIYRLGDYQFFTPPKNVGYAVIVDVDRPEAVLEIFERIPVQIAPSWVVPTKRGAQAGWFIDPVNLSATGRDHPIRYARAVGTALRAAVDGDPLVDPLSPARVRNPAYEHAGTFAATTPPVYRLRQLERALKGADLWTAAPVVQHGTPRVPPVADRLEIGQRNQGIFDAARFVAYAGGDYMAEAWAANQRCVEPLGAREVQTIINSITRFITTTTYTGGTTNSPAMSDTMRQALAEMGRKGGKRNTPAQQAARAKGPKAATKARKHRAYQQARQAQHFRRQGHSSSQIAEKLGKAVSTISRYLRRWIPLTQAEMLACITGASGEGSGAGWSSYSPPCGSSWAKEGRTVQSEASSSGLHLALRSGCEEFCAKPSFGKDSEFF